MHPLLARQLKRAHERDDADAAEFPPQWRAFLEMVEQAYRDNDADRALMQRANEISSAEFVQYNHRLLEQNQKLHLAEQELRRSRDDLEQRVMQRTTELQEAKDFAESINQHFQLLLNSTGEGIYGIDLHGLCTFVNIAAAKTLGFRVEEMIGMDMHTLIHHSHPGGSPYDVGDCPIYWSMQDGQGRHVDEEYFWRRDGTAIPVDYMSYPMRDGPKIVGAVIAFSDISARKAADQQLRQAKEAAEQGSRAKSEFLARMSHEIRTPLNGIMGMIDSLGHTPLDEAQRKYVSLARVATESLMVVISDILDFSKIEAGKIELERIEFSIHSLVGDLIELFRPVAAKKNLTLSANVSAAVPARVCGDGTRVRQVLTNLISNAVKFTSSGSVSISATLEPHQTIYVSVTDTGSGIPAEGLHRLFKSFSQVDTSVTRRFGGTGLGLAICKRLVELMGGQIGVRSEPQRGTTFWFRLPLEVCDEVSAAAPASAAKAKLPESQLQRVKGLHFLVAEDNELNQFVTAEILKRFGCTCEIAANGELAVEAYLSRPFDAILMDCQMPALDGLEATRRIRKIEADELKRNRIPIIALTADAVSGDRERCLASGMDGYVSKPINSNQLLAEILERLQTVAA